MAALLRETTGPAETEALGAELAARLHRGDVVLVSGELGSGKTTFVRGAAHALGVVGPVTSPTFSIAHRYQAGDVVVAHVDLYRLDSLDGEDPALLEDYLDESTIAFVEWPKRDAPALKAAKIAVELSHRGSDRRRLLVDERPPQVPIPNP